MYLENGEILLYVNWLLRLAFVVTILTSKKEHFHADVFSYRFDLSLTQTAEESV